MLKEKPRLLFYLSMFNHNIWIMHVGSFVARGCYYMTFPFLIIMLHKQYQIDTLTIGVILAASAFLGSFLGLYIGYLSDTIGYKSIILMGSILCTLSFIMMSHAHKAEHFFLAMLLCSIAQPMIYIPSRAVISDQISDQETREFALSFNYFLVNIAVAIGPLLGVYLSNKHPNFVFETVTHALLIYSITCYFGLKKTKKTSAQKVNFHFFETLRIVSQDKYFILVLVLNFLVMFIFAHIDSSLIQVISRSGSEQSYHIIINIYIINSITTVFLQFPLDKCLKGLSLSMRMQVGLFCMSIAQVVFVFASDNSLWAWGIAIFIISLGEVITFPLMNVQVDRIAPPNFKGIYYGATSLYAFGFALAPFIGGIILKYWDAKILFLLCFALSLLVIFLYRANGKDNVYNTN